MQHVLRALGALGALLTVLQLEAASAPLAASAFPDDTTRPLDARVGAAISSNGVVERSVSFASNDGRVTGSLVVPARPLVRAPAVLFVHWLGDPETTNHTEFAGDARQLALHGVVSLLIDAMWSRPHWFTRLRTPAGDPATSVHQVVDLRRSLDLLLSLPGVDPQRVAYVGHDFGAMYGAVLSGVDARPRFYVLMAGTDTFAQWYLLGPKPADVTEYRSTMSAYDPPQYLARSRADAYLLQFASHDEYVDANRAAAFAAAAPAPKLVGTYVTDHSLEHSDARADRLAWLLQRLGVRQ